MATKIKAKKYVNDDGFENYKILEKKTLNYFDVKANSNKYYTIELHQGDKGYRVFTDYGRLGVTSTKDVRETDDLVLAKSDFNTILREKLKKGYTEIELAQSTTGSDKAKELIDTTQIKTVNSKSQIVKSSLDPVIQSFVKQIFDEAGQKLSYLVKGTANSDGSSPLGKLSSNQIDKGRHVLQEIADIVARKNNIITIDDVLGLSNEYYRYIPKVFGHRVTADMIAIKNTDEISEQMDILKFYEDSLRMGSIIFDNTNIDKQYESLKSDIGILDPMSDKYKQIVHYVNSTESRHHGIHLDVKHIYTVNQKNAPKFDDHYGNVRELFHGSRSANLPGILSSHLKLPNQLKGVYITGAMFGPGLYFADQSTKSSQYSCARFGGSVNKYKTGFMFLADVSLGRMKEEYGSHYYTQAPKGYDSVKGCEGRSLLHNEYIIYRETQQQLRYIIEFEPKSKR